ncbi:glycosyltransferase [Candidatus Peregrinibacteria bacterium]|nr:glycosyltransferase [Candidatus Peregrinibacteria bacterium]
MPNNQIKASIVILDFRKSKRVCENVESIQKQQTDFEYEIIIVDNSCLPENAEKLNSLKKYANVQVYINEKNTGYIRANNQGVEKAKGEFLLIVNPDIVWDDALTLQKMVDYMEKHPEIGIMGPKQINDDTGQVAMTVRAFPNFFLQVARRTFLRKMPLINKWVAHDEMQHLDYDLIQPVDWLQSSFWIVRRTVWEKLGGLNKAYFIFMSDPDLCFKCWEKGYKVVYNPEVVVHADGRRASEGGFKAFFQKWTLRQHVKDAAIYQFLHLGRRNPHKHFKPMQ